MTGLPDQIVSARLRLILVTPADAADMRAGRHQDRWHPDYPSRDAIDASSLVRAGETWGPRHLVADRVAVGSIGFFGPPVDGETEVGYGLVPAAWGHGYAVEGLRALLAESDRLGVRVRASVRPENARRIRVLAACGFTELRGSDEEGQLVMARPLPS